MSVRSPDPTRIHSVTSSSRRGGEFRKLGEEALQTGWRLSFVRADFESPDGERFDREIVRHPGAVAVVPATDHGTVLLVRQYRGSIDRWLLELPAGCRDVAGEDPAVTAGRELEEEVGVRAGAIVELARTFNSPGFCDQETALYLATDLTTVTPDRHGAEEQYIEVVELSWPELDAMSASGELSDAMTLLGLALARPLLGTP